MNKWLMVCALVCFCSAVQAQRYPERKWVRAGNTLYEKGKYTDAEVDYRRALELDSSSYEALNNLSNTLYKQERYEEAAQLSGRLAQDTTRIKESAQAKYNEGNALFKQRKLQEAIDAYKHSLRVNPQDQQTKFNLAYAQKLLQEDQNKNDQNKDQNKEDQNKDQDKDKQDNKGDKEKENQDQQEQKPNPSEPQPQEGGMQKSEAERMLDAIQSNEDNTKKKVDAQKMKTVGRSGKNW